MSKGKALFCELKTGHIWKLHMYRELSVLHVRTQKPSLNRVQRFTMCVCVCVCVCVFTDVYHTDNDPTETQRTCMGHYILIHVHIAFVSEGRENGKGRNKEGRKGGRRREGEREGGKREGGGKENES